MKTLITPVLPLLLATPLAAQGDASPLRLVPRDALVVARMEAPAGWPAIFADTRLGEFLSGSTVRDVIAPLREDIEAQLEEARREAPAEANELLDLLLATRGHVSFALDLDFEGVRDEPIIGAMVALTPGPDEDGELLAALSARVWETAAGDEGFAMVDQLFGDSVLRAVEAGHEHDPLWLSVPQLFGDSLVTFVWTGERDWIERWARLDAGERFDPSKGLEGSAAVRISLRRTMDAIATAADANSGLFDGRALLDRLGLLSLREMTLSVRPADDFVAMDMSLGWEGDGGVMEVFVPERPGTPRLIDLAPRNALSWSVSPLRVGALYDLIGRIWDDNADRFPITREDAEDEFAASFKVRLREDFLDLIGGELLSVADQNAFEDEDIDDPFYMVSDQSYAIELADAKAFDQSFETMLRARGMHAARKTTDYRGFAVHRLRLAGIVVLDYAITDRMFVFALNSDDLAHLHSILDEEAARRAGDPPAPMPESVATRLELMQPGWCGISVTDVNFLLDAGRFAVEGAIEEEGYTEPPEEVRQILDALGRVQRAMRDAGLDRVVSTTWAEPGRMRARLIW